MLRDNQGRFTGGYYPEIEARIAADNERALKIVKVCEALGFKPEVLEVKQLESGNWSIDYRSHNLLLGLGLGLAVALKKTPKKIKDLLFLIVDAADLLKAREACKPKRIGRPAAAKGAGARASV
jgi:hypothetical protein